MTHMTRAFAGAAAAAAAVALLSVPAQADENFQPVACNQIPNVGKLCIDRSADGSKARGRITNTSGSSITGTGVFEKLNGERVTCSRGTTGAGNRDLCTRDLTPGTWRLRYERTFKTTQFAPRDGTYVRFN